MQTILQDLRYAFRQLRRSPGFTVTAVLILALGIGANAAIFTLVHAVLLRDLPVADPATIIRLGDTQDCCVNGGMPDNNDYALFAYDLYRHLQANAPEFEQLAAVQSATWKMTVRAGKPEAVAKALPSEFVSGNYAVLRIDDNGPGLTNQANLFVPFYTTKPGGTGIGLLLAQQIATAHGGSIALRNRREQSGCEAEVRLPLLLRDLATDRQSW